MIETPKRKPPRASKETIDPRYAGATPETVGPTFVRHKPDGKLDEQEDNMTNGDKRQVKLVRQSYQPTKAEMEEPITFPEGTTPDDIAKALMRPVDIDWKDRP